MVPFSITGEPGLERPLTTSLNFSCCVSKSSVLWVSRKTCSRCPSTPGSTFPVHGATNAAFPPKRFFVLSGNLKGVETFDNRMIFCFSCSHITSVSLCVGQSMILAPSINFGQFIDLKSAKL